MFVYDTSNVNNDTPRNFLGSILLSVLVSVGTFLMPISIGVENGIQEDKVCALLLLIMILTLNAFSFSAFCEIVKTDSAKYKDASNYGFFYTFYFKTKHPIRFSVLLTVAISFILIILYAVFNGIEHIKGILLYTLSVCFSYSVGLLSYNLVKKGNIGFRKRDYLLYKPFFTMSFPLSCGIYVTDLFNGKLQYVSLLIVFCIYIALSYICLKKQFLLKKSAFAVVNICTFVLLVLIYIWFGFSKPGFIFNNINALLLSICYGVYLSGLLSLSYTVFFPVKTDKIRHSIVKFRICLFNFAPAAAFPLLLYYFDNSWIIYLFIIVNLIAVNCAGKSENSYNIIFTLLLIAVFVCTTLIMFQVDGFFVRSYNVEFSPEFSAVALAFSILLSATSIYIALAKKENNALKIPDFVKKDFTYYLTTLLGQVVLLIVMSFLHVSKEKSSGVIAQSDFAVYMYIFSTLTICGGRFIFEFLEHKD